MDSQRVRQAFHRVRDELLAKRSEEKHWVGELSSSPLSTATAIAALAVADKALSPNEPRYRELVQRGLDWMIRHANEDGGWGDTDRSFSNISTTVLCWAALALASPEDEAAQTAVARAEGWLTNQAGGISPEIISRAVTARYGKDKTFSVPILTMAALMGRLGEGREAWRWVKPLPFELAAFPADWYARLNLPVVSYALPALIAMGIARHTHLPSRSPIWRGLRATLKPKCMTILNRIQPPNGGFLEATPLTSFVAMSLASSRLAAHPVTVRAIDFIVTSVREDGSWAIDTNLATWVSTLSVNALGEVGMEAMPQEDRERLHEWLAGQQFFKKHPYTGAAPGGWAWTPLPGGVPDADDTAGALVALRSFWKDENRQRRTAKAGSNWLYRLQNNDGGIPTFCKGWGHLPFDRSSHDITAHVVRAWIRWIPLLMPNDQYRAKRGLRRAVAYLLKEQRGDGTWCPLWFGNQEVAGDENPSYGTARVVVALSELEGSLKKKVSGPLKEAIHWMLLNQNDDGGWGGGFGTPSSWEETALITEALLACIQSGVTGDEAEERWIRTSADKGLRWLLDRVEQASDFAASPIGFYFAKLWYYEDLYPLIFVTGALRQAMQVYPELPEAADETSETSPVAPVLS